VGWTRWRLFPTAALQTRRRHVGCPYLVQRAVQLADVYVLAAIAADALPGRRRDWQGHWHLVGARGGHAEELVLLPHVRRADQLPANNDPETTIRLLALAIYAAAFLRSLRTERAHIGWRVPEVRTT
jgi:hypothetical protein